MFDFFSTETPSLLFIPICLSFLGCHIAFNAHVVIPGMTGHREVEDTSADNSHWRSSFIQSTRRGLLGKKGLNPEARFDPPLSELMVQLVQGLGKQESESQSPTVYQLTLAFPRARGLPVPLCSPDTCTYILNSYITLCRSSLIALL